MAAEDVDRVTEAAERETWSAGSRTGQRGTALKSEASRQLVLDRFVDRISKLSGRVEGAAVERILDNAAKAVADLEVSNEQ
jgi:hypothetical protein